MINPLHNFRSKRICTSVAISKLLQKRGRFVIALIFAFMLLGGCSAHRQSSPPKAYDVSQGWQTALPEEHHTNASLLKSLDETIQRDYQTIRSVLILRNGYIIFEEYYHNTDADTYHAIYSITKSIMSMLTGIAIDQGLFDGVDQSIATFFPVSQNVNEQAITLQTLLTMSSGADDTSFRDMRSCMTNSEEWHGCLGTMIYSQLNKDDFFYNEYDPHLLSITLSEASGLSALEFANTHLFAPLQIEPQFWEVDMQGHNRGGYGLHLRTRDLAKLGYLYLNDGMWGEQQIVSSEWITESTQQHRAGGPPLGVAYGYLWWLPTVGDYATYAAFGRGGQLLLFHNWMLWS